jgi:hypothetical protein
MTPKVRQRLPRTCLGSLFAFATMSVPAMAQNPSPNTAPSAAPAQQQSAATLDFLKYIFSRDLDFLAGRTDEISNT